MIAAKHCALLAKYAISLVTDLAFVVFDADIRKIMHDNARELVTPRPA